MVVTAQTTMCFLNENNPFCLHVPKKDDLKDLKDQKGFMTLT